MDRVVIDTDVIVAAMLSAKGASRRLLLDSLNKGYRGLISVPLLVEYEAVLKRREHMTSAGVNANDVDVVLDQVAADFDHVTLYYLWRPFLRDADDDMVLETAVNGRADYIATFNLADFTDVESTFGIEVLRPGDILKRRKA